MTHGLMGNNGLCFPELDGKEGGWGGGLTEQRNTDPQNQSASLHQHPPGIHPLISKTVDASVSKRSPQHTPLLLQVKARCRTSPGSQERGGGGGAMLYESKQLNTFKMFPPFHVPLSSSVPLSLPAKG